MRFTDSYRRADCTAGRGVLHHRPERLPQSWAMSKSCPGRRTSDFRAEDVTIAGAAQARWATPPASSARSHLGDLNKFLAHGARLVDEFFGNLYHLNAEEEPENRTTRARRSSRGCTRYANPRGVLHCWANRRGQRETDERHGPVGKTAENEDTGPAHEETDGDDETTRPRTRARTSSGASTTAAPVSSSG